MATRQIKAHYHDGVFVPDEAIELVYGLTEEGNRRRRGVRVGVARG